MEQQKGFTLIELSIVLVIVALLAGGVLVGQDLIEAAENRRMVTQIEEYQAITYAFRMKYNGLPGDLKNATTFWGNAHTGSSGGECNNNVTDTGTGTQTCNGTGNKKIGASTSEERYERFRYWQHLSNAGLIEDTYTGVNDVAGASDATVNVNIPSFVKEDAGSVIQYLPNTMANHGHYFDGFYGQMFLIIGSPPNNINYTPVFKPMTTLNIDTKLDDGAPGTGNIRAFKSTSTITPGCTTTDDSSTALYSIASSDKLCALIIRNIF